MRFALVSMGQERCCWISSPRINLPICNLSIFLSLSKGYLFISSLVVWFPTNFFEKNPIESLNSSSKNLSFGVENITFSILGGF